VYDTPAEKKAKREKAEKIRQELLSGKRTWEDAVKESTDLTKTINGDLPSFTRHNGIIEELAAVGFTLQPKQFSEVVETPFGFHVLQLVRRDDMNRSLEESKQEIKRWLRREPYVSAIHEAAAKYPSTGIQAPQTPTRPSYLPEVLHTSQPSTRPTLAMPTTRPSTRPAPLRPTTRIGTRPASMRPATRPGQTGAAPLAPARPAVAPSGGQTPSSR
jgi:hypothetical protein